MAARCRPAWASARALPDFREAEARRAAERLISALASPGYGTQAWKVLIGTPLLLTLLCVIVLRGGQMPRQRVAFYDGCLRVLLERRSRAKQDETGTPAAPPLDAETALAVLRSIAWDLHRVGRRDDLKKHAAVNAIEERLEALGKEPEGFRVLDWLYREAGCRERMVGGLSGAASGSFPQCSCGLLAAAGVRPGTGTASLAFASPPPPRARLDRLPPRHEMPGL